MANRKSRPDPLSGPNPLIGSAPKPTPVGDPLGDLLKRFFSDPPRKPKRVERTWLIRTVTGSAALVLATAYLTLLDTQLWLAIGLTLPAAAWMYEKPQELIRSSLKNKPMRAIFTRDEKKADQS